MPMYYKEPEPSVKYIRSAYITFVIAVIMLIIMVFTLFKNEHNQEKPTYKQQPKQLTLSEMKENARIVNNTIEQLEKELDSIKKINKEILDN